MNVAIFGKSFSEEFNDAIYRLFEKLNKARFGIFVYKSFYEYITENLFFIPKVSGIFTKKEDLENIDLVFSVGGDGTFLECVALFQRSDIPLLGINSGRLGFLAYISKKELDKALDMIISGNYGIEERTLVEVTTESNVFGDFNSGLNELIVQKKDTSSMINIEVYLDGEYMTTYWADGLIVSTPTGSTAYSLSAGGPILTPGSETFVITPIAPHNLTVRPIVVPDSTEIKIVVHGRSDEFLAALDARNVFLENGTELIIRKSDYKLKMVSFDHITFFYTLRTKLMWGMDARNGR